MQKRLPWLALLSAFIFQPSSFAQIPSALTYQGRLQVSGTDFTGTGQFKFALVDAGSNTVRRAAALATVNAGVIAGISLSDGGSGYSSAPSVTITDATGTGAAAVAVVAGGAVVAVNVISNGSGYSPGATVTIAPPPPVKVHVTYWSHDGTSVAGGAPITSLNLPVSGGLFSVILGDTNLQNMQPLSPAVFVKGDAQVRIWFDDGENGFVQLAPDQPVTAVAYAMLAAGVTGVQATMFTGPVTFNPETGAPFVVSNSTKVVGLNVDLLDGLDSTAFWKLQGNAGTTPGTHFLGTTDNRALELRVNGRRALRLEPAGDGADSETTPDGALNVIGGSFCNFVAVGVVGATIGGGGATNWGYGGPMTNVIRSDYGTIAGGMNNTVSGNAWFSTIGGGESNDTGNNSATVAGGSGNHALGRGSTVGGGGYRTSGGGNAGNTASGDFSTIAGGYANVAVGETATIGGGSGNDVLGGASSATIGGGTGNTILTNGDYATIPGGWLNTATNSAFAAGRKAHANHSGSFVWADVSDSNAEFESQRANQMRIRAYGGARFDVSDTDYVDIRDYPGNPVAGIPPKLIATSTGAYLSAGGSWVDSSDASLKENFAPVNTTDILSAVCRLSISTWNYKREADDLRHIGPTAQDFQQAFRLSPDDTHIAPLDGNGVALAAIQGLNQKLESRSQRSEVRSQELDAKNAALEKQVAELKALVQTLAAKVNGGGQ